MIQQTLGIIGVGAFGEFMLSHLAKHFAITLFDASKEVAHLAKKYDATKGDLAATAACEIVVLSVPVQRMETVLREIAPLVKPKALVIDVASVKVKITELMQRILPAHVDIIGTHPLFGPQSGKDGIEKLNIAVCNVRGDRAKCVVDFLSDKLKLAVHQTTPQEHDKELAYVQGVTHLLAKVIVSLNLPKFRFTTKTYEYMDQMVEMIRYDSDELFKAIERENPFSGEAKKAFFTAARNLEEKLAKD